MGLGNSSEFFVFFFFSSKRVNRFEGKLNIFLLGKQELARTCRRKNPAALKLAVNSGLGLCVPRDYFPCPLLIAQKNYIFIF